MTFYIFFCCYRTSELQSVEPRLQFVVCGVLASRERIMECFTILSLIVTSPPPFLVTDEEANLTMILVEKAAVVVLIPF